MNTLLVLIVLVLIALVALLWYGVRTHKTVAELQAKAQAEADALKQKVSDAVPKV